MAKDKHKVKIPKVKFHILGLEAGQDYPKDKTLFGIATKVYGRPYIWDTYDHDDLPRIFDYDEEYCREIVAEIPEHHPEFEQWLNLPASYRGHDNPHPDTEVVLCDLIVKGYLPYGKYIIEHYANDEYTA